MLINYIIKNIAICFYGPLFTFLNGGQPGPRANNVSSLSLGYKDFLNEILKEGKLYQKQVVDLY